MTDQMLEQSESVALFITEADKLEEKKNWQELIEFCLKRLQSTPKDLEVLKRLAYSYLQVRDINNVEKYCNEALSLLPEGTPDRIQFERMKQKIMPNKNIPDLRFTDLEPEWVSYLSPEKVLGQTWVTNSDISEIDNKLSFLKQDFKFNEAQNICIKCWQDILYHRNYEVPSKGRIEIFATEKVKKLLQIQTVRFVQEGAQAPEVYLRFEFSDSKIGIVKIKKDGTTRGFHERSSLTKAIVDLIALTYYCDLVVPSYDPFHEYRKPKTFKKRNPSNGPRELDDYRTYNVKKEPGILPRRHASSYSTFDFREWHWAQHRVRHNVVGHIRWVHPGYDAGWEKQEQAWSAGVSLPIGYTWVIEHDRGGQECDHLVLDGNDLAHRTRFYPPERAKYLVDSVFG